MSDNRLRVAVVGGGMFFDEVVGQTVMDFQRYGLAPYLGSIGQGGYARPLADTRVEFCAVGTHSEKRGTAGRIAQWYREGVPDATVTPYYGDTVWEDIIAAEQPDLLIVVTPDDLHYPPIMYALEHGVDVITEKPLCLKLSEANEIIATAAEHDRIVAVDMHKRYDPMNMKLFRDLVPRMGDINYIRAVLEEPLEISTEIFKWADRSNPFSYVGCHWTDVVHHYLGVTPVSLHATGQKNLLVNWTDPVTGEAKPVDTFDSIQVKVTYDNGMEALYVNAWINPVDFEGPVNQEIKVFGTLGSAFMDQQDRGLRYCITGEGSRTTNPFFNGLVPNYERFDEMKGYGKDSLTAGFLAAARHRILGEALDEIEPDYPTAASQRGTVALVDAAAKVAERNLEHTRAGRGSPVTAFLGDGEITILDPYDEVS
ncbi:MAG: Gfo/Idh/MocA family oxidoreductase [Armatimonadetes bacterium]|nr:Gfo/Idh/MocA family oxidoreductase [Armatimonadota bacterium]